MLGSMESRRVDVDKILNEGELVYSLISHSSSVEELKKVIKFFNMI